MRPLPVAFFLAAAATATQSRASPPPARADPLAAADALAAQARALPDEEPEQRAAKDRAVDAALEAYATVLAAHAKDQKLAPRTRRRRASLLQHAGRLREALAEHDAIVAGRARRKDRARALYDGAKLIEKGGDFHAAEQRMARAVKEYPDVIAIRAKASLSRGALLERMMRPREAAAAYRYVVDRCWNEVKPAVAAYDALALLALADGRPKEAQRWLRACMTRYHKRAQRDDRFGAYLSRLLGAMKAPARLARPAPPPAPTPTSSGR